MKKYMLLCLGLCLTASGAWAQQLPAFQMEEMVVTATRNKLSVQEAPQSVEVITNEDIKKMGAASVRDALRFAASLYLMDGNGAHGDKLTLRGSSANDVLIILDGHRMVGENFYAVGNDSANARILDRLNLSSVERIEIVRGQAGALYGSDAQAGVINIITKRTTKQQAMVGFSTGSRRMNNYYRWNSGQQGKVNASLDVNFGKLRDFSSRAEGFSHGPYQSYVLNMDYTADEDNRLNLYLDYQKQKFDFTAAYDLHGSRVAWDNHRDYERKQMALTYDGHNDNSSYSLRASYGELTSEHQEQELALAGGRVMIVPHSFERKYKLWNVEARDTIHLAAGNKLTIGSEASVTDGGAFVQGQDAEITQQALYLQDEWYVNNRLLVIPSLRYDHHESFGGQISPNLGMTYFAGEATRVKLNYGKAYRAPSVDELYGAYNHMGMFTFYGNPDLQPEETTGWELALERDFTADSRAKLTYFKNEKKDAISYRKISEAGALGKADYRFVNLDATETQGVELTYTQELGGGWQLAADYTYLDTEDKGSGQRLDYSARNTYTVKLSWTEPRQQEWSVLLFSRWYDDYHCEGRDYSASVLNLAVNRRWGERYRAYVALDNLLDKDEADMSLYARLWRVGVEMNI